MKKIFEKKLLYVLMVVLLIFELSFILPDWAFLLGLLNSLFFGLSLFFLLEIKPKEKQVYPIFILPIVLALEMSGVLFAIPSDGLKQLFILSSCFLLYLVTFSLEAIRAKIEAYSFIIYNVLVIANLIAVFLGYILFFGLYFDLLLFAWIGMLIIFLATFSFYLFSLWQNNFLNKKGYLYAGLLSFLILEFFWAISLLPFIPLRAGFVLFLIYYSLSDIFIIILKKAFTAKKVINHLVVPVILLVFVLLSAGW